MKATEIILPRHVFGKDRRSTGEYMQRVCNPIFDKTLLDIVSKVKVFEWPKKFADASGHAYPDCYGLYRVDNDRCFLLRFQDDGRDESNRPHTITYETVLCDIKDGNTHDKSLRLASFLDPRARQEVDVVAFRPVDKPDETLVREIEEWLKKDTGKLYINAPDMPQSTTQPASVPVAQKVPIPSVQHRSRWHLIVGAILLLCLAVSLWFNYSNFSNTQDAEKLRIAQEKIGAFEEKSHELSDANARLSEEVKQLKDKLSEIRSITQ
jgi:hypothetical protein